jgi:hypothetical protein
MNACPLLNNPRYIFIVQRLSILSKLDSNNPYCICAELYFLNLNYLIILDTWPIQPSRRRTGADLYVNRIQPIYGDNTCPPGFGNNNSETTFSNFCRLASSISESEHARHLHLHEM